MDADACFNSILLDLDFLYPHLHLYQAHCTSLSYEVKYLRIFHLCARKWGTDDASLEALLVPIEDLVSEIAQHIHRIRLIRESDEFTNVFFRVICAVEDEISSVTEVINQWYIDFSNSSRQSCCSQDRDDELLEFINTILEAGYSVSPENSFN